ncbi:MAG: VOC family protein [Rhodococcus sp. (in: high G+C Gram-positive bacteria)]
MTETSNSSASVTEVRTVVWPTLRYRDARGAIAFLVDVLGFVPAAVYGEDDRVDHAELRRPGGGAVMLGSAREDTAVAALDAGVGSVYVTVDADELVRLHDSTTAAGATIVDRLRDQDYGGAGFTCRDPEGVHWSFGTYRGHTG